MISVDAKKKTISESRIVDWNLLIMLLFPECFPHKHCHYILVLGPVCSSFTCLSTVKNSDSMSNVDIHTANLFKNVKC